MKRAKNCFRFVDFQQVDGKPKGGDTAFLQPTVHKGEKLLRIEINRTCNLGWWRFSGNNIVPARAGLEEKPAILHNRVHTRIEQRIGVVDACIKVGEPEHLL